MRSWADLLAGRWPHSANREEECRRRGAGVCEATTGHSGPCPLLRSAPLTTAPDCIAAEKCSVSAPTARTRNQAPVCARFARPASRPFRCSSPHPECYVTRGRRPGHADALTSSSTSSKLQPSGIYACVCYFASLHALPICPRNTTPHPSLVHSVGPLLQPVQLVFAPPIQLLCLSLPPADQRYLVTKAFQPSRHRRLLRVLHRPDRV